MLAFGTASAEPVWVPFDSAGPIPPTVNIVSASPSHVKFHVIVHGVFVEDTVVDGATFQKLSFPGEGTMSDLGRPQLPQVTRLIGFASGAGPLSQVELGDQLELEGYYVFPAQIPEVDSYPGQSNPFMIDNAVYGADAYFPALGDVATAHELGVWRELGAAVAIVRPFHFNPVQRKLIVYRTLTVTYTFAGGSALPAVVTSPYYRAYAGSLSNFGYLGISETDAILPLKYMIVLGEDAQALRQAVEPLRVWKWMQGYDAQVHCVGSEIPREQNAIRSWIASWCNPGVYQLFVLFVGDKDLIPSPGGWLYSRGDSIYSDHWYACVAGGPGDDIADVDLGRIPSSDPAVVSAVVQKFMRYERYIDPGWEKTRSLMVSHLGGYVPCKERIANRLEELGRACIRQRGDLQGVTNATVQDKINNQGGVGIVNYRGHGLVLQWDQWNTYGQSFRNEEILELTNSNWLPLVYEICCCCGNIGSPLGEGHSEVWCEYAGGGGVAAWGATRPSWTDENHVLDESLCTIPYTRQITYTNVVMNAAKLEMLRISPTPEGHDNNRMYHLMGDPSLHVWMADSGALDLTFGPRQIDPGVPYRIDAHVTRATNSQPVRDAAVGVYKQGEILGSARTDANGYAFIWVYAQTGGLIKIAASKPLFHGAENVIFVNIPDTAITGGQGGDAGIPREFALWVPPVSRGALRIRADTPLSTRLRVTVCDATGRVIATVPNLQLSPGTHWLQPVRSVSGSRGLAPGSYFVRYESDLGSGLLKSLVVR
jgi:hypothetical protein